MCYLRKIKFKPQETFRALGLRPRSPRVTPCGGLGRLGVPRRASAAFSAFLCLVSAFGRAFCFSWCRALALGESARGKSPASLTPRGISVPARAPGFALLRAAFLFCSYRCHGGAQTSHKTGILYNCLKNAGRGVVKPRIYFSAITRPLGYVPRPARCSLARARHYSPPAPPCGGLVAEGYKMNVLCNFAPVGARRLFLARFYFPGAW